MFGMAGDVCCILVVGFSARALWSFPYVSQLGVSWIGPHNVGGGASASSTGQALETWKITSYGDDVAKASAFPAFGAEASEFLALRLLDCSVGSRGCFLSSVWCSSHSAATFLVDGSRKDSIGNKWSFVWHTVLCTNVGCWEARHGSVQGKPCSNSSSDIGECGSLLFSPHFELHWFLRFFLPQCLHCLCTLSFDDDLPRSYKTCQQFGRNCFCICDSGAYSRSWRNSEWDKGWRWCRKILDAPGSFGQTLKFVGSCDRQCSTSSWRIHTGEWGEGEHGRHQRLFQSLVDLCMASMCSSECIRFRIPFLFLVKFFAFLSANSSLDPEPSYSCIELGRLGCAWFLR